MIVAAMLSFMGISGVLGKINLSNLEIDIKLPREIYAKEEIPVKVTIKNKKKFLPSFLLRVRVLDKTGSLIFLDKNSSKTVYINLSFEERGYFLIKEVFVCSIFPFNFFIRCKPYKINKKVLIFPKPRACNQIISDTTGKKRLGKYIQNKKGYTGELLYIRDYNYADPIKYIHWKASAKVDTLKTKELSTNTSEPIIINLDKINTDIERKLSCAVFLILNLYKKNIPFGLKTKNKIIKPSLSPKHKIKILKELALYGKDKN
ncbi:MAG: DUF58 domain-containing protein [Aquificae bacterium]|nr:DUF58 domain-containing protein [Aquificota bacterium]